MVYLFMADYYTILSYFYLDMSAIYYTSSSPFTQQRWLRSEQHSRPVRQNSSNPISITSTIVNVIVSLQFVWAVSPNSFVSRKSQSSPHLEPKLNQVTLALKKNARQMQAARRPAFKSKEMNNFVSRKGQIISQGDTRRALIYKNQWSLTKLMPYSCLIRMALTWQQIQARHSTTAMHRFRAVRANITVLNQRSSSALSLIQSQGIEQVQLIRHQYFQPALLVKPSKQFISGSRGGQLGRLQTTPWKTGLLATNSGNDLDQTILQALLLLGQVDLLSLSRRQAWRSGERFQLPLKQKEYQLTFIEEMGQPLPLSEQIPMSKLLESAAPESGSFDSEVIGQLELDGMQIFDSQLPQVLVQLVEEALQKETWLDLNQQSSLLSVQRESLMGSWG